MEASRAHDFLTVVSSGLSIQITSSFAPSMLARQSLVLYVARNRIKLFASTSQQDQPVFFLLQSRGFSKTESIANIESVELPFICI